MINFSSLGTSIFATGLGMTILNKFSDIWNLITKYIKISYTIHVSTLNNRSAYQALSDFLYSIDNKSLNKNVSFDIPYNSYLSTYNNKQILIGEGIYLLKPKWNQFIIVNSTYDNNSSSDYGIRVTNHSLNVKIYGVGAKNLHKSIIESINEKISINKQPLYNDDGSVFIDKRSFDTIYHQKKNEIIKFLDNFKSSKDLYIKNELPYKTGILLYGPPGTGKTSIIKAIANYMGYSLYMIDLNSKNIMFQDIRPNTVIVFEDIDKLLIKESNQNNSKNENITNNILYSTMQLLDGLCSINDVIYVATTNYIEKLPPELIRSGRFDCKIELDEITKDCAEKMCENFGLKLSNIVPDNQLYPINPSYLQSLILDKINSIKEI